MSAQKTPEVFDLILQAPFGPVGIHCQGMKIHIMFLSAWAPTKDEPTKLATQIARQVNGYLKNPHQDFNLPLVFRGTPYQRQVWQAINNIPSGRVLTYGELADQIDSCPRAVANACGANYLPLIVPCHRVVAKDGIGGFMAGKEGGVDIKQWLLRHEGVTAYDEAN